MRTSHSFPPLYLFTDPPPLSPIPLPLKFPMLWQFLIEVIFLVNEGSVIKFRCFVIRLTFDFISSKAYRCSLIHSFSKLLWHACYRHCTCQ